VRNPYIRLKLGVTPDRLPLIDVLIRDQTRSVAILNHTEIGVWRPETVASELLFMDYRASPARGHPFIRGED
jgi:hypothetical protein